VHDYRPSENRIFDASDGNIVHGEFVMGLALVIGLNVPKIASVAHILLWQPVLMAFGIIMSTGAHAVRRGTIAKLMDVHGVLLARRESLEVGNDLHGTAFFSKAHGPLTFIPLAWVQNGHGLLWMCRIGSDEVSPCQRQNSEKNQKREFRQ